MREKVLPLRQSGGRGFIGSEVGRTYLFRMDAKCAISGDTSQGPTENTKSADTQAVTLAVECTEMAEVRHEIDRLDRLLVRLLSERQGYIEAAGRIKSSDNEVRLAWRIEDVVAKVLDSARREGLSKRIAEPVWRELIDRCIDHEHEIWAQMHLEEK